MLGKPILNATVKNERSEAIQCSGLDCHGGSSLAMTMFHADGAT